MHAVRRQILEILKATGGATVAELADQLEMAPVSVRHHLDILQGDNLIRVGRVERNGTVGRPQQFYVLTAEATELFPNNFAALAAGLLEQMKENLPPEQVRGAFHAIARSIANEADLPALRSLQIEERLDRVADFLNERGYLARWEANANGSAGEYLLYKFNCPYNGISSEHSELCAMDQILVDELVGENCCRIGSVAENGMCCTYRIGGTRHELVLTA